MFGSRTSRERRSGGRTTRAALAAGPGGASRRTTRLFAALLLLPTVALQAATTTAADAGDDDVCSGEHRYPAGKTSSFTYTAPAGYLISAWCVKAGPTPEYHHAGDGHDHTLPAASVTITHSTGKEVSHYSVVLVPAPEEPLTLTVDALGELDRTYGWAIDKEVDRTQVDLAAGQGTATFRYTVTARALGATSSGWYLGGTATVRNPNPQAAITLTGATVSTDLGGGAVCTPTLPAPAVVPAASGGIAGTLTIPFSCSFSSQPSTTGTVHAAVTWDPAGPVTESSAAASDPVTLALDDEFDKVVDVVDDKTVPGRRVVLEKDLVWSEGLVRTYTYDVVVAGPAAGTCADHTNTAVVDQPGTEDPSDSVTVRVCSPPPPPPPPPVPGPVVTTVVTPAPPEVLTEEAFGRAVGSVTATCQGTVRSRMGNRTGERVVYTLRIGTKTQRVAVKAGADRKLVTHGPARALVVLKARGKVLDRVRIPHRCAPPEVLPDTGARR